MNFVFLERLPKPHLSTALLGPLLSHDSRILLPYREGMDGLWYYPKADLVYMEKLTLPIPGFSTQVGTIS